MEKQTCICGYCFPGPPGSLCGSAKGITEVPYAPDDKCDVCGGKLLKFDTDFKWRGCETLALMKHIPEDEIPNLSALRQDRINKHVENEKAKLIARIKQSELDKKRRSNYICPGTWHRGCEHESQLTLFNENGTLVTVDFKGEQDSRLLMEYALVQTFYMWPHPNAPRTEQEPDYPQYRQKAYQKLMSEMREKGYL